MNNTDKLDLTSPDIVNQNIEKIAALFPNCVTETAKVINGVTELSRSIDFDLLKQELNHEIVEGTKERYRLEWPGKKEAIVTANLPTTKTLRPVRKDSVNFDTTENLYIEGDNLEVLKILQESYLGKIKMIYIDPPYNTGKDFVYKDNFTQDSTEFKEQTDQIDEYGNRLVANPETAGRYHSDWLSMMYPRLKLARNLLTDDGVIFMSIDDNEVSNLKKVCDEIFGENNFIGAFCIRSTPNARDYGHIGKMHEYCLFYVKSVFAAKTYHLPDLKKTFKYDDSISGFNIHPLYNSNEAFHKLNRPNLYYPFYIYTNEELDENGFFKIGLENKPTSIEVFPPLSNKNSVQFVWRWGKSKAKVNLNKEIVGYKTNDGEYRIIQKMRTSSKVIRSIVDDKSVSSRRGTAEVEELFDKKVFSFPKPISLIKDFLQVSTTNKDIILDFFSGSASTAHAVMQLNAEDGGKRKFILAQLPELTEEKSETYKAGFKNICEIGKERIRRAAKQIVNEQLAMLNEKKETLSKLENSGVLIKDAQKIETLKADINKLQLTINNLDTGFKVYKTDTSNMQDVYYKPQDYNQAQLDAFADNIKPNRSTEDLLTQVLLDWGLPLTLKTEILNIQGKEVFKIAENSLMACFSTGVDEAFAKEVATHQPLRMVFKDSAFKDDTAKENVKQLLKQLSPNTEMKVI